MLDLEFFDFVHDRLLTWSLIQLLCDVLLINRVEAKVIVFTVFNKDSSHDSRKIDEVKRILAILQVSEWISSYWTVEGWQNCCQELFPFRKVFDIRREDFFNLRIDWAVPGEFIICKQQLAQLRKYKSTSFHSGVIIQELVFCNPRCVLEHRVCDVLIVEVNNRVSRRRRIFVVKLKIVLVSFCLVTNL